MSTSIKPFVVFAGFLLNGCAEQKINFRNDPPAVGIESPSSGFDWDVANAIEFRGWVSDSQDSAESLIVVWESSIDGEFYDDPADASGDIYFNRNLMSPGLHTITLTATDTAGESASQSVEIQLTGDDEPEVPDDDSPEDSGDPPDDSPDNEDTGEPLGEDPTVDIDNPLDGSSFLQSEPVAIRAYITDDQEVETVDISILSGIDGALWTGNPDEYGIVAFETAGLSVGTHTIRVVASDSDGNNVTEQIQIDVLADARPGVVIESPGEGDWYWTTDIIRFQGTVSDDVTDPQDLAISWESNIDGVFSTLPANSTGSTIVDTSLSAGIHTIFLTAVDEDGNESSYNVMLEIRDPLDHDGDLDGYTENEGDCDDYNPYVHPGAEEICDDYDNNCNGEINEEDADELEENDSLATATDLGRIDDGWIFSSAEVESAGITLHTEWDEDWIRFDAGDDFLVDNVNIDISVGSFPHTGDYVIELYALFESDTVPVDVDMGYGRLSVQFEGDPWDGGEDDFAVRIYADDWPGGTCSRRFEVEIVDM